MFKSPRKSEIVIVWEHGAAENSGMQRKHIRQLSSSYKNLRDFYSSNFTLR